MEDSKKGTILVVEDEPIVGMEIQESLQKKGYNVPDVVSSGDAVLPSVMSHKPALIIMDIKLKSFIDGIDAAQRVKLMAKTPIIYLTGQSNDALRERAMQTSPEAFLTKPYDEADLYQHVERILAP